MSLLATVDGRPRVEYRGLARNVPAPAAAGARPAGHARAARSSACRPTWTVSRSSPAAAPARTALRPPRRRRSRLLVVSDVHDNVYGMRAGVAARGRRRVAGRRRAARRRRDQLRHRGRGAAASSTGFDVVRRAGDHGRRQPRGRAGDGGASPRPAITCSSSRTPTVGGVDGLRRERPASLSTPASTRTSRRSPPRRRAGSPRLAGACRRRRSVLLVHDVAPGRRAVEWARDERTLPLDRRLRQRPRRRGARATAAWSSSTPAPAAPPATSEIGARPRRLVHVPAARLRARRRAGARGRHDAGLLRRRALAGGVPAADRRRRPRTRGRLHCTTQRLDCRAGGGAAAVRTPERTAWTDATTPTPSRPSGSASGRSATPTARRTPPTSPSSTASTSSRTPPATGSRVGSLPQLRAHRRRLALHAHARVQRPPPDGLGRLRPAGRELRHQDGRPPAGDDRAQHRQLPPPDGPDRPVLRLVARDHQLRARLLPLDAVVLPAHVRARARRTGGRGSSGGAPCGKTILANEQVEQGRCWRCGSDVTKDDLEQWYFRITDYAQRLLDDLATIDWPEQIKLMQTNWIGRSEGAEVDFALPGRDEPLTVFTTRPDTLFGATYMVLAPEHPLVDELTTAEQRDGGAAPTRTRRGASPRSSASRPRRRRPASSSAPTPSTR